MSASKSHYLYANLINSGKGGVGKTEISVNIHLNFVKNGIKHSMGEIDPNPRLSGILGTQAVPVSLPATPAMLAMKDRNAARDFFHPIFGLMSMGHSIIDFGGTVNTFFYDWLENSPEILDMIREEGVRFRVIVPIIPEGTSADAAKQALERAYELFGTDHGDEFFLVYNDIQDNVKGFNIFRSMQIGRDIEAIKDKANVTCIELPNGQCDLMTFAQASKRTAHEVLQAANELHDIIKSGQEARDPMHRAIWKALDLGAKSSAFERRAVLVAERKRVALWINEVGECLEPLCGGLI